LEKSGLRIFPCTINCQTRVYVMEFFAWRDFQTPKQVGALAGLTPTPYQSGQSRRELGIAKAGNRHIRVAGKIAVMSCWA
jgi:transposase